MIDLKSFQNENTFGLASQR